MPRLRPVLLLLLALLCGCSAYEAVFHPYRLPTPEPSPEFKRQLKAKKLADKTRGKASRAKKPKSAAADAAAPDAAADAAPPDKAAAEAGKPPANSKSTVKYDKGGLMKKPKLLRRRITKPTAPGGGPVSSIRNFFKYKLHGKHKPKPKPAPADAAPADGAPADAEPTPDK